MEDNLERPVGSLSTDQRFRWDGRDWRPLNGRRASAWTRPQQLATAASFLLAAALTLFVQIGLGGAIPERIVAAYRAAGLPVGEATQMAHTAAAVADGSAYLFAILYLVVVAGSLLAWRWTFWFAGALLLVQGWNVFGNLSNVLHPAGSPEVAPGPALTEIAAVVGVLLLVWYVAGLFRFGWSAWARPRATGAAEAAER